MRLATPLAVLAAALALSSLPALAAAPVAVAAAWQDGGMEEFAEVDPYTEGDAGKIADLGYVRMGSFLWEASERTEHVQETMGGLDVLWVETAHFRIGSSLGTYRIPNDRDEKAKLKEEFKLLKKRLKKFKPPKRDLDPWLRLHLFALRAEAVYEQHLADFGIEEVAGKPNAIGHPKKFNLLLCQRKSELGRYLRAYEEGVNEYAYRTGRQGRSLFFGINMEAISESYTDRSVQPFDTMLHCIVAQGLARNFLDGHLGRLFTCPEWFSMGLGHVVQRRIDVRFVQTGATERSTDEEHWHWDDRVGNLVKNDFFATMPDMVGWERSREWNERDHMVVWSKVEFLLEQLDGDGTKFLSAMVIPVDGKPEGKKEELVERQTRALESGPGLTPDEFDKKWTRWARKR
ncbi:MAG: hypothetical protein AAF957_09100 [Planctomycetota bacterium]